ncbi:hypothetical protein L3Q82_012087 [Scortum barcoo]|uniref:Uncharacterized protein n=1 Tax=Scortum barcoo TaxID=214431 RepID=A0ACB8W6H1_9TELE|nr:hypothetical protein L3Q82_012087 [Scortum barcoo]
MASGFGGADSHPSRFTLGCKPLQYMLKSWSRFHDQDENRIVPPESGVDYRPNSPLQYPGVDLLGEAEKVSYILNPYRFACSHSGTKAAPTLNWSTAEELEFSTTLCGQLPHIITLILVETCRTTGRSERRRLGLGSPLHQHTKRTAAAEFKISGALNVAEHHGCPLTNYRGLKQQYFASTQKIKLP